YSALLSTYLPIPIRTEQDNKRALTQVEALIRQESLTEAETDLFELLVQLIEHFEDEHYAFPVEHQANPLDMLKFLMESNDLKQVDLVGIIGSKGVVSEVINGKRGISKAMAISLGQRFNVNAGLFLA
ncbi:MAG: transcriptional regulator, partial [Cyanobacteria bacterium J06631_9]